MVLMASLEIGAVAVILMVRFFILDVIALLVCSWFFRYDVIVAVFFSVFCDRSAGGRG